MTKKSTAPETVAEVIEPGGELVIESMTPGTDIVANFEALRAHITSIVADYTGVVVDKSGVGQAKKDRAYLNGLSKSLNQRRIDVKKRYMAPVDAFEAKVKELDAPIKEASAAIDEQVKAFEEQERRDKRAELVKHWTEFAGVMAEAVPYERIEEAAWLNASFGLMAAFEAIETIVGRIAREDAMLDGLNLTHHVEAKAEYFATLDVTKAIDRSKQLDEQVARAAKLEADKAEIAAEREAVVTAPVDTPAPVPAVEAEPVKEWTFTVRCTVRERDNIVGFLKVAGIKGNVVRAGEGR
jgi:hypothetical protein